MATHDCSAIVLTGGNPQASDGPFCTGKEIVGDRCLLDHLIASLRPQVDEIIIVAENPIAYLAWDVLIVKPQAEQPGCLNSLHAGLFACRQAYALVATCDRPLIQKGVIQSLLAAYEPKYDAVLPCNAGVPEPLPAVFSKRSLTPIRKFLEADKYDLMVLIDQLRIKMIDEIHFQVDDPELITWLNVNLPEELSKARDWLQRSEASQS
jgi:molybdopterin-guanine dinucleotide biosynthesis protein A